MKIKKIYLYEVEIIVDGEETSPIFTDSASEALAAVRTLASAGFKPRLYRGGRERKILLQANSLGRMLNYRESGTSYEV